jgi:hypothetical protein
MEVANQPSYTTEGGWGRRAVPDGGTIHSHEASYTSVGEKCLRFISIVAMAQISPSPDSLHR